MTTNLKRSPLAILRPAACVGLGLLIAAFGGCNGGGGGLVPSTPGGNPGGNPGGGDPGGGNPGGGNNPGGGTGGGPTNSGSYSMTEFNYQDPNPESYHPLGDAVFCMDREELAAFTDLYAAGASGLVMDDADHGHADVAPIMPMWPAGTLVFDAKGGQLDDDFRREIAVVGVYPPNPSSSSYQAFHTQVNVLATDAGGTLVQQSFFTAATDLVNASLELADVDGDGRDEILVAGGTGTRRVGAQQSFNTSGTRLRIFDDAVGGHLQLFDYTGTPPGSGWNDCRIATGNFDDDEAAEIAVLELFGNGNGIARARVLDDANHGYVVLASWTSESAPGFAPFGDASSSNYYFTWNAAEVVAGDFDGDEHDEIVFCGVDGYSGALWRLARYDDAGTGFAFVDEPQALGGNGIRTVTQRTTCSWQLHAADLDGNGTDGIVRTWGAEISAGWQFGVDQWSFGDDVSLWLGASQSLGLGSGYDPDSFTSTCVIRDTLEARDRIAVGTLDRGNNPSILLQRIGREEQYNTNNELLGYGLGIEATWQRPAVPAGNAQHTLVLAGSDLQGDSIAVRYTGTKHLTLAHPMPICVMAAAPTKAGISQNFEESVVTYGQTSSTSATHTVTSATTVTANGGLSGDFMQGFFSAGVRYVYEQSIEEAYGSGIEVAKTLSYIGGSEDDHIVFQGTLYRSYDYDVLTTSDPTMAGKTFSLDVPVSTRIYKWTLDYYNANVDPEDQIDRAALLGHTIGDPSTYLTLSEAQARAGGSGWLSQTQTVGQGTFANTASVEITNTNSTEQSRTISNGLEVELQIGPLVGGVSVGIGYGDVYTIETGVGTLFEGSVGDIDDYDEYSQWSYAFGAVLYHQGGSGSGERGFQVLHFWVDPVGTAY